MFDHLSLGVSDVARSRGFYDASLGALGLQCLSDGEESLGYGDASVGGYESAVKGGFASAVP